MRSGSTLFVSSWPQADSVGSTEHGHAEADVDSSVSNFIVCYQMRYRIILFLLSKCGFGL